MRGRFPIGARLLAALVGMVFLAAGLMKATDLALFVRQIEAYGILTGTDWVTYLAWFLIPFECALGAALLVWYRPRVTLGLAALLLAAFIGVTSWASLTGITDDCGCFGPWMKQTPEMESLQNILLLVMIVAAWWMGPAPTTRGAWRKGLTVSVACAVGLAVCVVSSGDVLKEEGAENGRAENGIFHEIQVYGHGLEYVDFRLGDTIVVLFGTNCAHCRESVSLINALAETPDLPEVIALCTDDEAQCHQFVEEFLPVFPIGHIDDEVFWRLLGDGNLPRVFLVRNGTVMHTWNASVPDSEAVRAILVPLQSSRAWADVSGNGEGPERVRNPNEGHADRG